MVSARAFLHHWVGHWVTGNCHILTKNMSSEAKFSATCCILLIFHLFFLKFSYAPLNYSVYQLLFPCAHFLLWKLLSLYYRSSFSFFQYLSKCFYNFLQFISICRVYFFFSHSISLKAFFVGFICCCIPSNLVIFW